MLRGGGVLGLLLMILSDYFCRFVHLFDDTYICWEGNDYNQNQYWNLYDLYLYSYKL
jgi:hypothetical protein